MDGVADDALLVDDNGEGETLIANPCHHVFGLDEVRPCEVVFVGNALGRLGIVVCGGEEHDIRQLLLPLREDGHFGTAGAAAGIPEVNHHDATLHAVVRPCASVHILFRELRERLTLLGRIPRAVGLHASLCQRGHRGHHVQAIQELVGVVNCELVREGWPCE